MWFAVRDLEAQTRTLRVAGFKASRNVEFLGASGREFKVGSGVIVLLAAGDKSDALKEFLSGHDEGIFALSVEVSDLSKAQSIAQSCCGSKIDMYGGVYGKSFLLSPNVTHGVWLEMFQRQ